MARRRGRTGGTTFEVVRAAADSGRFATDDKLATLTLRAAADQFTREVRQPEELVRATRSAAADPTDVNALARLLGFSAVTNGILREVETCVIDRLREMLGDDLALDIRVAHQQLEGRYPQAERGTGRWVALPLADTGRRVRSSTEAALFAERSAQASDFDHFAHWAKVAADLARTPAEQAACHALAGVARRMQTFPRAIRTPDESRLQSEHVHAVWRAQVQWPLVVQPSLPAWGVWSTPVTTALEDQLGPRDSDAHLDPVLVLLGSAVSGVHEMAEVWGFNPTAVVHTPRPWPKTVAELLADRFEVPLLDLAGSPPAGSLVIVDSSIPMPADVIVVHVPVSSNSQADIVPLDDFPFAVLHAVRRWNHVVLTDAVMGPLREWCRHLEQAPTPAEPDGVAGVTPTPGQRWRRHLWEAVGEEWSRHGHSRHQAMPCDPGRPTWLVKPPSWLTRAASTWVPQ